MLDDLCDTAISIKEGRSEDEWSFQSSPTRKDHSTLPFKVKCPFCYGTGSLSCRECGGSESISSLHPLAQLLNDVLSVKIDQGVGRGTMDDRHEQVSPIKEEEEDQEQGQGRTIPTLSRQKQCHCCGTFIENCFSMCITCQQMGSAYWVCGECSDSKQYDHPPTHVLEPIIDYASSFEGNLESVSPTFMEGSNHYDRRRLTFARTTSLTNGYEEEFNLDEILMTHRNSEMKAPEMGSSRVEVVGVFESQEYVGMDMPLRLTHTNSQRIPSTKAEPLKMPNSINKMHSADQTESERQKDYIFGDYQCDCCQLGPIINVRYHCKHCPDYDLCQQCYIISDHHHAEFERIDGRQIKEKAKENILGLKSTNGKVHKNSVKKRMTIVHTEERRSCCSHIC